MDREFWQAGIEPTPALDLRVSVAALARVQVKDPEQGLALVVLERTATVHEGEEGPMVVVRAKPFGGAVRLRNVQVLRDVIGEFHFDSHRSRQEGDFRILIRTGDWPQLLAFCLRHLAQVDGVLEASPMRELAEEFQDALGIDLEPEQVTVRAVGIVVEAHPVRTASVRAPGQPTVRIYSVYDVRLKSPEVIYAVLDNSMAHSDERLHQLAWEDWRRGGKGRANAVLALPLNELVSAYRSRPAAERTDPLPLGGHMLDGNVPAILPEVECPKYWRSWSAGPTPG